MEKRLTYDNWNEQTQLNIIEENKDFLDILKWAYRTYGDSILYSCSFGAEGIVLLDLISKIAPGARVVFLDTGVHFKETYDLIEQVKKKYPVLRIDLIKPDLSLEQQAEKHGERLWETNPNLCCNLRKLQPLAKELGQVDAWISGLRREQSPTRKHVEYINKDERFKKVKICPLIHWTWDDVWNYIQLNDLPYNPLHDQDYPSIGCETCTLPAEGSSRSGRWSSFGKTECGLHQA
ncbi:phosphoadenylyl-sulfate reductase [Sediminibacillus massiliensis]|uniref:phosphoadenylyl-sulfate reductase n=1 Tax=Sediminibacillus massiliensis TaxID=1926277 RepID=UPI00098893B1|nr:phosphoadenylyl-sulfate reductase [Sediminibacillus massiliensis]